MGVIRERLNEVLLSGSAGTTPTRKAAGAGGWNWPAASRVPMPTGERFAESLRGGTPGCAIPTGERFAEALRK